MVFNLRQRGALSTLIGAVSGQSTGVGSGGGEVGPTGPPGPQGSQDPAVSTDGGNLAGLGTDSLLMVRTSVLVGVTDGSEGAPGTIGEYVMSRM